MGMVESTDSGALKPAALRHGADWVGANHPSAEPYYSERNASVTLTRAARSAGNMDAMMAAATSKTTEAVTGKALGICSDGK